MSQLSSSTDLLSASQLAGLPGMPSTSRGVRHCLDRRAAEEGWEPITAIRNGGSTKLYPFDRLPEATQAFFKSQAVQHVRAVSDSAKAGSVEGARIRLRETLEGCAEHNRRTDSLRESISLASFAQARLTAKLDVIRLCEIYRSDQNDARTDASFAASYNSHAIQVSETTRAQLPTISERSLRRWRGDLKLGITSLAGKYGNRKGASRIDQQPDLRDFVLAMLVKSPHVRATQVIQAMRARFRNAESIELPSKRALQAWLSNWKNENAQTFTALSNPDEWKSRFMVAQGSASEGIVRLNQRWEMDSTPADVMLTEGRHSIIGVIDVFSRRAQLLVSKSSKATAVATAIRNALLEWGAPEEIKTDNGSDYTAHHVERVLAGLDIKRLLCTPFQPQQKPHIERFFGTFARDMVEMLDGFIGHSVAERKAIESRKSFADRLMKRGEVIDVKMTAEEFQFFCDRWCEDMYQHNEHRQLQGRSPFEVAAGWRAPVRRIDDERALDLLLAEAPGSNGLRTVQKKGVEIDRGWFIAPELERYVGQPVQVRLLPDAGRVVVYGGPDLQFICIAVCPERAGIDRQEIAAKARETQKRRVQEERAALRAIAKKAKTDDIVGEILRDRAIQSGKVTPFPKRHDTHDTPALRSAADAITALNSEQRTSAELMSAEDFAVARARIAEAALVPQPTFETPFQRAYWLAEQAYKRALAGEEQDFLDRFRLMYPREAQQMDATMQQRFGALGSGATE